MRDAGRQQQATFPGLELILHIISLRVGVDRIAGAVDQRVGLFVVDDGAESEGLIEPGAGNLHVVLPIDRVARGVLKSPMLPRA